MPLNLILSTVIGLAKSKKLYQTLASILICIALIEVNNQFLQKEIQGQKTYYESDLHKRSIVFNKKLSNQNSDLRTKILDAKVSYAWQVISYGLKDASSHEDIRKLIFKWAQLKWGAQIAALRILCQYDRKQMSTILAQDDIYSICRVIG